MGQELPADRETEGVEAKVVDKVLHLAFTVMTVVLEERRIGALSGAGLPGLISGEKNEIEVCFRTPVPSQPKSNPAMFTPMCESCPVALLVALVVQVAEGAVVEEDPTGVDEDTGFVEVGNAVDLMVDDEAEAVPGRHCE